MSRLRSAGLVVAMLPGCATDGSDETAVSATDVSASTATSDASGTGSTTEGSTSDPQTGTTSSGGDETTESGAAGSSSDSSTGAPPAVSCAGISEAIGGAVTCRDEATRCSLTVPAGVSCTQGCEAMEQTCLRAYPESESCTPAVYLDGVECDTPATESTFCQCGDTTLQYPEALVVTIGDSTMDNTGVRGESGWGNELPPFAVRPRDIHNQGSSGASSLDFETRPNWPMAQALLGPNVYLLIQFGHNDTSDDPNRHTEPGVPPEYDGTYHERLLFYVDAAREAGATPVILTSLGTMDFNRDGTTTPGYMAEYVLSARRFAEDEGLMVFDANAASRGEYERLGPEQTLALYSFDETTHFTPAGAMRMAELTVRLGCVESEAFCAQFLPL